MKNKHQRCHRSKAALIYKTITASLPFIEVNLNLTAKQISMLNNGLKYVIPCQSRFQRESINETLKKQYEQLSTTVKNCLRDNAVLTADERAKQAFSTLEQLFFKNLQTEKIPKQLRYRAHYEYKTVRSIQHLLKQRSDIVIRRTDKSKVFYIGRAADFTRKSEEYMLKTSAYEEITSGRSPLAENLSAVQSLLDYLRHKKNVLSKELYKKLSPNVNKLELGHYHGLPKPHKVNILL